MNKLMIEDFINYNILEMRSEYTSPVIKADSRVCRRIEYRMPTDTFKAEFNKNKTHYECMYNLTLISPITEEDWIESYNNVLRGLKKAISKYINTRIEVMNEKNVKNVKYYDSRMHGFLLAQLHIAQQKKNKKAVEYFTKELKTLNSLPKKN